LEKDFPQQASDAMSKKKKNKAKGKKPAGNGGASKRADYVANGEEVKQERTLNSEMQRLKVGEQQTGDDALLEEAIKLAAVEKKEIEEKEKENCKHGCNQSSSQERFCEDFVKTFMDLFDSGTRRGDSSRVKCLFEAACAATTKYANQLKRDSIPEQIRSYALAKGVKFILDGNNDDARVYAMLESHVKVFSRTTLPDQAFTQMFELADADEHTLVQFFRKRIPCSCLDEKYKEVKHITKMGLCCNPECPLPGKMVVRSKMVIALDAAMPIIAQESVRKHVGQSTKQFVARLLWNYMRWGHQTHLSISHRDERGEIDRSRWGDRVS
jgi:hypothetical protein